LCIVESASLIRSKCLLQYNIPTTWHLLYNVALIRFFCSLSFLFLFLSRHTQTNNNRALPRAKCIRECTQHSHQKYVSLLFRWKLAVVLGRDRYSNFLQLDIVSPVWNLINVRFWPFHYFSFVWYFYHNYFCECIF